MKKTFIPLFLVLALLLVSCTSLKGEETLPTISVSASATVSVKPDAASVSITAEALEPTTEGARNESSRMIAGAVAILKDKFGITDDDITTVYMNISPYYEWLEAGRTLMGQRATQQVRVVLKGEMVQEAGKVYDTLSVLDGLSISSVSFYKEDTTEEAQEARRLATLEAKAKAEAYAEGLGLAVGKAISISDGTSHSYTPYLNKTYAVAEAAMASDVSYSSTTYYSGDLEVSAQVSVLFSLK